MAETLFYEVVMPRLGWNMEMGALAGWRKNNGDPVKAGEILFEVESDKAVQEVEALDSGTLRIPPDSPELHEVVPVGTLLAYLDKPGTAPGPRQAGLARGTTAGQILNDAPVQAHQSTSDLPPERIGPRQSRRQPAISPRAVRLAVASGLDWTGLKGSGRTGRIIERDVRQAADARNKAPVVEVRVSPLARRMAEDLGVDLAQLAARLPGRRIERADIEAAAAGPGVSLPSRVPFPLPGHPLSSTPQILPISTFRRLTAERLAASAHTAAPVTLTTEADATELVRLRGQLKEDGAATVPSYTDLFTKVVAQALTEHPQLNARFEGDSIIQPGEVNLGIAVDSERGLVVPVLRSVQAKSLVQIAQESAGLIEKVRGGRIKTDDLEGGTFTITNLGMYEIDAFTPIINLPECAILGIGRIVAKQVVVDVASERVAIRHMLFLSLTFDHRLVDGAPAARFLQRVKQYVEKPYLWLVS